MIAQNTTYKKLTDKQEAFCQAKARCPMSDVQAYRQSGYKDGKNARQSAHELITNPYIIDRIAEIKAYKERKVVVTQQSVAREADDLYHLALSIGDIKAANAALVTKAKAYGCLTDKTETSETVPEATAEQLEEFRRISQEILYRKHLAQDNTLAGCMSGCRESDNSGPLSQKQG